MLQGVIFDLAPEVAESKDLRELLDELELCGIDYVLSSGGASSSICNIKSKKSASSSLAATAETAFTKMLNSLAQSPKDCLILTDCSTGISSARAADVPCIGYAPPESCEDMSGAYALFEDFASIDVAYLCRTHAHAVGYPADILQTERLIVREFSKENFPTLYSICTETATASYMEETISDYEAEQEKHDAYIRNIYPFFELALWGIFEKVSGTLVGRAGFSLPDDNDHTFSLGYLIDVPYRRRGYAKELIPALLSYAKKQGYTEISARIKKGNTGSVKALEQCGFPYECREIAGILIYTIQLD